MSHNLRRPLAIATALSALFLALPAPSQAVILGDWQPATVVARAWAWLENLSLIPRGETPSAWEKQGSWVDPDGQKSPGSSSSDQGNMIDPDGHK